MRYLEPGLYVRIQPARQALRPVPWQLGLDMDIAYRVLGYFHREVYGLPDVLLAASQGQSCFIPMCHLRAVAYMPGVRAKQLPLREVAIDHNLCLESMLLYSSQSDLMQPQALSVA